MLLVLLALLVLVLGISFSELRYVVRKNVLARAGLAGLAGLVGLSPPAPLSPLVLLALLALLGRANAKTYNGSR